MTKYIFLFLSTLGLIDASFLTYQHFNRDPFSCPLFGGCEEVTNSIYSEIFGIPISLLGVIYYATVFLLSVYSYLKENNYPLIIASHLAIGGFLFSLYLVYIMLFVIGAVCFYCIVSAVSSVLLFVFGMFFLKKEGRFLKLL